MTAFKEVFPGLELAEDALRDPLGVVQLPDLPEPAGASDLPTTPAGLTPLEARWWQIACADLRANIVEGRYFGAGREFGPTVFTRDIALSAVLALNQLHPELMWQSLKFDRELRFHVGWKVIRTSSAPDIESLPFERTPHDYHSFVAAYRTGDFSRRTDDVVWLWAAHDWLRQNPKLATETAWRWVYETGARCFAEFYDHFFDGADGLYRGQSCFVDIMMCGYPSETGEPPPGDASDFFVGHVDDPKDSSRWRFGRRPASLRASIMGKAASTNALYVLGLGALADIAQRFGLSKENETWRHRQDELRTAMRREFFTPGGRVNYRKAESGEVDRRQHALGTALVVLAGVVSHAEAERALDSLPRKWGGVPLFDPFYADNPHVYHNRSAWPFVDALVHKADFLVRPTETVRARWIALAGRACRDGGGFRELVEAESGRLIGSKHQLWSAAGYCGAILA